MEYLLGRNRLEAIDGKAAVSSAAVIMGRASRRLLTAEAGLAAGDLDGAFAAAYDAYRMAAEALLMCQALRATGGDGSHMTVEDVVSAQFSAEISRFAKPTFERFRRKRHSAQYFDPTNPEITLEDSAWAIATARAVVEAVDYVLSTDPPGLFS